MTKIFWIIFFLLIGVSCSKQAPEELLPGSINSTENPVPQEYVGITNPLDDTEAALERGQELFQKYCATCHGDNGEGDGPAAASLDPPPQNLQKSQSLLRDDYLYWRISEGGSMEPFKSSMPPWKSVLEEDEIWEIIEYIRSFSN
jgi:mono/diheme cytochrome c family protein